jgi:hypothetical protein
MRDLLHGLAIAGALAVAVALSPAMAQGESTDAGVVHVANAAPPGDAQGESPAQAADPAQAASPTQAAADPAQSANPTQSPSLAPAPGAATAVAIPADDLKKAGSEIRASWHDYDKCTRSKVCSSYFESFGVGLTFGDGEIVPFAHVQRLTASRHDCIVNARDALDHGNRGMAVQWVMASQMLEPLDRNWLGDHPDAVLEALRHIVF